ncbi:cytochrome P450 [Actinorugispora endophytica]|uniref:Cytochrome P450 n=1 Tax=Actinorugispora endophytica TaxID=1605990 RepID=A0A4R6V2A2_9ACTN|nr:cytochrome P450 [Actinorugispora endophytica]TDQ54294.1 cytochrome P450 [Actinorugispora endophytica]
MTNPFEDPDGSYLVLANDLGQHSLWPASLDVPRGWTVRHERADRAGCLEYVERVWTDIRPTGPAEPVDYPFRDYDRLEVDPVYAELRRHRPVLRVRVPYGDDAWLVTRHEDVKTVLADPRFSRALAAENDESRLTPLPVNTSILGTDPPDHTRLRRLLGHVFTPRKVEALRPRVRRTSLDLLAAMESKGAPGDLVEDFSLPLTALVVCELLGVPHDDRPRFRVWLDAFSSTTALSAGEVESRTAALYDYIGDLVGQRRRDPREDLISAMVKISDDSGRLSEKELVELASVLLIAGYETTSAQLMNSVHVLFSHPGAHAELRADPALLPKAVDELLRFVPLDAHVAFARYAREDVELSGTLVRAGEAVLPVLPSANRDASVFEDPDRLDLRRGRNPHLGFGHGIHRCVGAPLARIELEEGLDTLLRTFPGLRPAVPPEEMEFREGIQVRMLRRLPVRW